MHITLFFLSFIVALYFILMSKKISLHWIKRTFITYGLLFSITAIVIGMMYMEKNKPRLKQAISNAIHLHSLKKEEPMKPMVSRHHVEDSLQLEVPSIEQLPELPRGCEVTSLAMLLQHHDIEIDKMELAKKIEKDPAPYQITNEGIHFGNPHNGFVGDMYSFETPGLGVYHEPIADLAADYVGKERVHDFSGEDFHTIIDNLNEGYPVWVIINATYQKLSKENFTTWHTSDGPIEITMRQHSVLITGYDHEHIYFNDPLNREEKALLTDFKAAWEQMGKQAITIYESS